VLPAIGYGEHARDATTVWLLAACADSAVTGHLVLPLFGCLAALVRALGHTFGATRTRFPLATTKATIFSMGSPDSDNTANPNIACTPLRHSAKPSRIAAYPPFPYSTTEKNNIIYHRAVPMATQISKETGISSPPQNGVGGWCLARREGRRAEKPKGRAEPQRSEAKRSKLKPSQAKGREILRQQHRRGIKGIEISIVLHRTSHAETGEHGTTSTVKSVYRDWEFQRRLSAERDLATPAYLHSHVQTRRIEFAICIHFPKGMYLDP
jgi:hypothetical protein